MFASNKKTIIFVDEVLRLSVIIWNIYNLQRKICKDNILFNFELPFWALLAGLPAQLRRASTWRPGDDFGTRKKQYFTS